MCPGYDIHHICLSIDFKTADLFHGAKRPFPDHMKNIIKICFRCAVGTPIFFLWTCVSPELTYSKVTVDAWGPHEGAMGFNAAEARCTAKKMRLPSRDELMTAYDSGANRSWDAYRTGDYWSGTVFGDDDAYQVDMSQGYFIRVFRGRRNHVRCVP